MEDQGAKIAAAVENAAKDVTVAVDDAVKDVAAAVGVAVKEGTAAVKNAGTALEDEVQNLIQSVNSGEEGDLKSSIVGFLRRIPKKSWFLIGLGVAGMVFAKGGGNLGNTGIVQMIAKGNIREMIAKGRRRFSRNRHHSI